MRFRFELSIVQEKPKNRQAHYKRMLCFFMVMVMMLSGCGSIILSGNLEFSANAPIEPMQLELREQKMQDLTFGSVSSEKYNIGGTQAFVVLPGHLSPADVPVLNEAVQEYNAGISDVSKQKSLYRGDFR